MSLRYGYLGTGRFAARCLELLSERLIPSWVVTAPAKPAGRGKGLAPSPVRFFAEQSTRLQGVPVVESDNASRDDAVLKLLETETVDFCFVVDFGQIIREPLLQWDAPVGCLNIHPSLLPLYRGAAPVQRALMEGMRETGVTVFKLAPGMDSGPIAAQRKLNVEADDDTASVLDKAAILGVGAFFDLASGAPMSEWVFIPQDESLATYAPKISREEERIDWNGSSEQIVGKIRGLSPRPGAWTTFRGKRLRILRASPALPSCGTFPGKLSMDGIEPVVSCGSGCIALTTVQMEGKKIQSAAEWKNGLRAEREECLL